MRFYYIVLVFSFAVYGCKKNDELPDGYNGEKITEAQFQAIGQKWKVCVPKAKLTQKWTQHCFSEPQNDFERCAQEIVKDLSPTEVRRLMQDNGTDAQMKKAKACKKKHVNSGNLFLS